MPINIGSNKIKNMFLGSTKISKAYLENNQIGSKEEDASFTTLGTNPDIMQEFPAQELSIDYSNYDFLLVVITGNKMNDYAFDDPGGGFNFINTTNADGDTFHPYMISGSKPINNAGQIKQSYREITLNKAKNKITFGHGQVMVMSDAISWVHNVPESSEEGAKFWISQNMEGMARPYKIFGIKGDIVKNSFSQGKCIWNRIDDDPNYPNKPVFYDINLKSSKKYNYYLPYVSSNLDGDGIPYSSYGNVLDPSNGYWYERYNEDDPEHPLIIKYLTKDDVHYWHCMCGHIMHADTLYDSINGGWYRGEFSQRKPPQTKYNAYRLIGGDPTDSSKAARIVLSDDGNYHLKYNNASWGGWCQDGAELTDSHGIGYYAGQEECVLECMFGFDEPLW